MKTRFATAEDLRLCESLQKKFGTTYYFASRLFPVEVRPHVASIYGFVRVPDEWVDNPDGLSIAQRREQLSAYREELRRGYEGIRPDSAVLRAFVDTATEFDIPLQEAEVFLDAMEMDLETTRYRTYADLEGYMRGSAVAVANMMLRVLRAPEDPRTVSAAAAMANAMQLTNFIRDIGEDYARGRIYMPLEDLDQWGVTEQDFDRGVVTPEIRNLLQFEIKRARELYAEANLAIPDLPKSSQPAVRSAGELYCEILAQVEANDYDVFKKRARTSKVKKLIVAGRAIIRAR